MLKKIQTLDFYISYILPIAIAVVTSISMVFGIILFISFFSISTNGFIDNFLFLLPALSVLLLIWYAFMNVVNLFLGIRLKEFFYFIVLSAVALIGYGFKIFDFSTEYGYFLSLAFYIMIFVYVGIHANSASEINDKNRNDKLSEKST